MATKFADHDPDRTVEFIDIEQKAAAGIITPYDPSVDMVGAENRGNVTCYLDALLFSMFAKIDAFECMLKNEFPEEDSRNKLVNLLRMWVNMLRTGKLVHTDMVGGICAFLIVLKLIDRTDQADTGRSGRLRMVRRTDARATRHLGGFCFHN